MLLKLDRKDRCKWLGSNIEESHQFLIDYLTNITDFTAYTHTHRNIGVKVLVINMATLFIIDIPCIRGISDHILNHTIIKLCLIKGLTMQEAWAILICQDTRHTIKGSKTFAIKCHGIIPWPSEITRD